jgi:hypothetical protein
MNTLARQWTRDQAWVNRARIVRAALHLKYAVACEAQLNATFPGAEGEGLLRTVVLARHIEDAVTEEKKYNGEAYAHVNIGTQDLLSLLGRAEGAKETK